MERCDNSHNHKYDYVVDEGNIRPENINVH